MNAKSVPSFLGIPAELRLEIYRYLLIAPGPIDIDWEKPRLQPNILRTCKQVLSEAHPILYDENTWKLHIGTPRAKLQERAVPVVPSSLAAYVKHDRYSFNFLADPRSRGMGSVSYFYDIYPRLSGPCMFRSLLQATSQAWGSVEPPQVYEAQKYPRRLEISVECSDFHRTSGWNLPLLRYATVQVSWCRVYMENLVKVLEKIPPLQALTVRFENSAEEDPAYLGHEIWSSQEGNDLLNVTRTYFGSLRNVGTVAISGAPPGLSSLLEHKMAGSGPQDALFLMGSAFQCFRMRYIATVSIAFRDSGLDIPVDFDWLVGGTAPTQGAMERGDLAAFKRYRKEAMAAVRGLGFIINEDAARVYEHDPDGEKYESDSDIEME
ncbi:hypothetical protein QBC34DRAFT_442775 [Podospora aff. communis PSN243]|uniref:F-box domain-containing protein n=1 Tax=Podospora aff. communis PSN243 TaxID=3040156 RepID=A0AAV9G9A9_9PEZI|nr:hypothetical protein QBC34DRAFT_442775 [Podospora aff. communis PSN243]